MTTDHEVISYHLNVDEGDCAIHAVFETAKPSVPVNAALVDGGRSKYGSVIADFLNSPVATARGLGKFSSVIATHWDGDHIDGILDFLYKDLQKQVQIYIGEKKWKSLASDTLNTRLEDAARDRRLMSTATHYDETTRAPTTRFYAPYWNSRDANWAGKTRPLADARSHARIRCEHGFVSFEIVPINGWDGTPFQVWVDIMVKGPQGKELLGLDLFSGDRVIPAPKVPESPREVSVYMNSVSKSHTPVLYCIGSDRYTLCPDERQVDFFEWTDDKGSTKLESMNLEGLVLRKKQHNNKHKVSTRLVVGPTSGNNEASIACMIIWPDAKEAKVTHYVAGDAGEEQERLYLRWATVEGVNADQRHPIRIRHLKLSHHGAKFSTPVFMLFAWQPSNIIVSNSMNAQWNHPAWQIIALLYGYTKWRASQRKLVDVERVRTVIASNLPVYVCNYWFQEIRQLFYVSPGSITSLAHGSGRDLALLLTNLKIDGFTPLKGSSAQMAHEVARITARFWDYISFVTKSNYGSKRNADFGGMMQPNTQMFRLVRIIQPAEYYNLRIFRGWSMRDVKEPVQFSGLEKSTRLTLNDMQQLPKRLGRVDIKGNNGSASRARRVPRPGLLGGPKTFENLCKDDDVRMKLCESEDGPDSSHESSLVEDAGCNKFRSWTISHNPEIVDAELFFIKASDAEVSIGLITHGVAEGHLDWFLGDLCTGAMVLRSKPPTESTDPLPSTSLDKTDETAEWFMFCMGNDNDMECDLKVKASVGSNGLIKLSSMEFQTKLKYLRKDPDNTDKSAFSETPVVFSAENNMHDFDAPKDKWPTNVATDDALVGPAHMVCLSLGPSPSIAGSSVRFSQILAIIGLQSTGFLKLLDNVAGLQLDTDKGRKNAIWYTPAEGHETTLRLCFKQAETEGQDLLASVQAVILQMTKVETQRPPQISIQPTLIVKKTWKLVDDINVHIQHELTFLLEVSVASATQKEPLQVQTALIFGDDKVQWVLNFKQGGEFGELLKFVASLFSAGQLDQKIEQYLPNCRQLALRRVVFTQGATSNSLEVFVQVTFGGMALLCSLRLDFLKNQTTFEFYGNLFPETRPALLGNEFSWVPYSSHYEPWTSLEIAPIKNSVGVLEDVQVSEVGDLSKAFNAFAANQVQAQTLEKSPTSLELVGLQFALTGEEISVSATVMSDLSKNAKVPALKLLAATLDLRYDVGEKAVSNCSLDTSIAMIGPDLSIPPAIWNLVLAYNKSVWTLSGGVTGLRGSLLYSLFDEDSNSEMAQLLSNMVLDLHLTYNFDSSAKASDFKAEGLLHLGHVILKANYHYPSDGNWTLDASLHVEKDVGGKGSGGSLVGVIESICGEDLASVLPDFVGDIEVNPVAAADLTSLKVVKLDNAILVLIKLQITTDTSIAFYQFQRKRGADKSAQAPPVKRALVFSLSQLPTVDNIPLIGSLAQPFDEARLLWIGGGKEASWTRSEIQTLNQKAASVGGNYPQIIFKDPGKAPQNSTFKSARAADDSVVLKSGFHLCLIQQGEIRLDHVFGGSNPEKAKPTTATIDEEDNIAVASATSPVNKTIGPVTILGVGLDIDVGKKELKIILDGTVKLGPIELTLIGFSLSFNLQGVTLTNFKDMKAPSANLDGLAVAFQKDPITIAGLFEHIVTDESNLYLGGAVVGFKDWKLEAGGYYGTSKAPKSKTMPLNFTSMDTEEFKAFLAYVRVEGPIATIGYAEIRGLVGGFGYNTSVAMPTIDTIQDFPFLAQKPEGSASAALTKMLKGGWFSNKQGQNWVAAGLTILAFQTLTVSAVVLVEWGSGVKLGVFGLATAEFPKHLDVKFAVVQLGIVATVDFDAGIMKVDGQLTPASYILHPSCHLTGGFAIYTWFGPGAQQGDWVFTIGGYHPSYDKPAPYPNPPRLGINWSYDASINITGGAYFAITPKMCMGGGSLHVTLTLGALYAYLDVFADFLVNYRPFLYQATGGVMVGVHYTLDLWLVTIPINVDLGAIITLQGPPLSGTVHVEFFVFGFDVKFGSQEYPKNTQLVLLDFYALVLQTTQKVDGGSNMILDVEDEDNPSTTTPPLLLNCISGLVSPSSSDANEELPAPGNKWIVRGAIFAFTLSCKFAVTTATVTTLEEQDGKLLPDHVEEISNNATGEVFAKPMQRDTPLGQSLIEVSIAPPPLPPHLAAGPEPQASNPVWQKYDVGYSNLPTALWGCYNVGEDPGAQGSDSSALLNNKSAATTQLMTSLTLYSPPSMQPVDLIAPFNVAKSMGEVGGKRDWFPDVEKYHNAWLPLPAKENIKQQYDDVRAGWDVNKSLVGDVVKFMASLSLGGWEWQGSDTEDGKVKAPKTMIKDLDKWWIEAPVLCAHVPA